ncbi:MAG: DUF411 domain-containing protein, partial [Candidatus Paceibacterota bacterium]
MKNPYIIVCLIVILAAGSYIIYNQLKSNEQASLLSGYNISVHKTPTCGCCGEYVQYLKDQGAKVTVVEHDNLTEERKVRHIPVMLESCHFSEIEGYVVEGHVPAEAIVKLLEERPEIAGIALPDMPAGSPGMSGT